MYMKGHTRGENVFDLTFFIIPVESVAKLISYVTAFSRHDNICVLIKRELRCSYYHEVREKQIFPAVYLAIMTA